MGFFSKLLGIEEEVVIQKTTPQSTAPKTKLVDNYTLGKKNLSKILAMAYSYIDDSTLPRLDLFMVFNTINDREIVFSPVTVKDYTQCLYYCCNCNIDFDNLNGNDLYDKLNKRLEKYFYQLGEQADFEYTKEDYETICTCSIIELYYLQHDDSIVNLTMNIRERNLNVLEWNSDRDVIDNHLDIIHACKLTLEVICSGYKIKKFLQRDSEFYKVHNKLTSSNIDDDIIIKKLYELFYNDLKNIFNYDDEDTYHILISLFTCSITEDKLYNTIIDKCKNDFSKMIHNSLEQNILEFPFEKWVSPSDIDYMDSSIKFNINHILRYLIETEKIDLSTLYTFYLKKEQKLIEKIANSIINKNRQQELDRILSGDLTQEVKKTQELYDFKSITDGFEFEEYVGRLYKKLGYFVEHTKLSGDQGADLIIEKDGIKTVIQTKLYSQPVGNKAVQEVVASVSYYNANNGIVVTNNSFTSSAIELAKKNNIELIDGNALSKMIDKVSKS